MFTPIGFFAESGIEGLLDLYPTAYAAWSLRKLRNDYSGASIQVTRTSDSATQDIGFVGEDLDTSALTTFIGAGWVAGCSPPLEEPTAPVGGGAEALPSARTSASANGANGAGSGSNSSGSKLHTGRGVSLSSNLSASAKAFLTGRPSPAALPVSAAASATSSEGGGPAGGGSVGDDTSASIPQVSSPAAAATVAEVAAAGTHGEGAGAEDQRTPAVPTQSQDHPSV